MSVKISQLAAAASVATTDEVEVNQAGSSAKATAAQILTGALAEAKVHKLGSSATSAFMTVGLLIDQGANDDEAIALKSSDIAHGMTSLADTDVYGVLKKNSPTTGGLGILGYAEANLAAYVAGRVTSVDTTKATTSVGSVMVIPSLKSGTTTTDLSADGNLFAIRNNATTRFIFDAEGSAHADVEWIAFDAHDDLALLNGLDHEFMRRRGDPIKAEFARVLKESRNTLQRERIVNFYDKKGRRAMVNFTRLAMLHTGAIRQLGRKQEKLEKALVRIGKK